MSKQIRDLEKEIVRLKSLLETYVAKYKVLNDHHDKEHSRCDFEEEN